MKTFESYSYSSSRHTKVNMLTAAIQMKYKLRHEQNSYWFKICNQKCTTGWKSQSFWLMLQSARISHQKWPWLKQYTFQSMSYTTNFIPNCGIVIGWTQLWSFTCPPYWYNQSQGIKQHEQWMAANGKMFIPSLKTRIAQNLSVGFGHTHTHTHTWAHPNMIQYTHIFLQNKEHRFFFLQCCNPTWVMASSFLRFLDHTYWTYQSVGLLWMSDQLIAETSTWQHTTDKHPCPRRDSNP